MKCVREAERQVLVPNQFLGNASASWRGSFREASCHELDKRLQWEGSPEDTWVETRELTLESGPQASDDSSVASVPIPAGRRRAVGPRHGGIRWGARETREDRSSWHIVSHFHLARRTGS